MLKRILLALMLCVLTLPTLCYGALPFWRNTKTYSTPYWKMNNGTKYYKVLFFEPTTWESMSLLNQNGTSKFPLTIENSATWTKAKIISDIIRPAIESYNQYNIGVNFVYAGDADGDNSASHYPTFAEIGNYSYVMISYGYGGWAHGVGQSGDYFKDEIAMGSTAWVPASWYKISATCHELAHSLGFDHEVVGSNPYLDEHPFCQGSAGLGNMPQSADMMGGLSVVYQTYAPVRIFGHVNSSLISDGYAEAYLAFLEPNGTWSLYQQMPLDTTGYYEFRMPIPSSYATAKVIVFTSKFNKNYDGSAMPYKVSQTTYISNTQPGNYILSDITLDSNTSGTLQQIQDATNIKMVY